MVELITSEDKLAEALAHEIGHAVGRQVVNKLLLTFTARALLKPAGENLHKSNRVIDKIILQFGGTVAMLAMLQFSRADEAQADLSGFYEMLRAGWDPHGFLKVFSHLDALEKSSRKAPIPFLSDHPATPERAAAMRRELTLVRVPAEAATGSVRFQILKSAMGLLPEPMKKTEGPEPQQP